MGMWRRFEIAIQSEAVEAAAELMVQALAPVVEDKLVVVADVDAGVVEHHHHHHQRS